MEVQIDNSDVAKGHLTNAKAEAVLAKAKDSKNQYSALMERTYEARLQGGVLRSETTSPKP